MEQKPWCLERGYQEEFGNFLSKLKFDFFGTIVFNNGLPNELFLKLDAVRRAVYRFHQNVDRKVLGQKFWTLKEKERTFFFAFLEHLNSNIHGHLLIKVPEGKSSTYAAVAPHEWKRLYPSGNLKLSPIITGESRIKTAFYSTKELYCPTNCAEFIISSEFLEKN